MPRESQSQNRPERGVGKFRVPRVESQVFGLPGGPRQTTAEIAAILQAGGQVIGQLQKNKENALREERREAEEQRILEFREEQKRTKDKSELAALERQYTNNLSNEVAKIQLEMSGGSAVEVSRGLASLRAMQESNPDHSGIFVSAVSGAENKLTQFGNMANAAQEEAERDATNQVHDTFENHIRGLGTEAMVEAYSDIIVAQAQGPSEVAVNRFSPSAVPTNDLTEPNNPPPSLNQFISAQVDGWLGTNPSFFRDDGDLTTFGRELKNEIMASGYIDKLFNRMQSHIDTLQNESNKQRQDSAPNVLLSDYQRNGNVFDVVQGVRNITILTNPGGTAESLQSSAMETASKTVIRFSQTGDLSATMELLSAFQKEFPQQHGQLLNSIYETASDGDANKFWRELSNLYLSDLVTDVKDHIAVRFNFMGKIHPTMSDVDYGSLLQEVQAITKLYFQQSTDRVITSDEFTGVRSLLEKAATNKVIDLMSDVAREGNAERNRMTIQREGVAWVQKTNVNIQTASAGEGEYAETSTGPVPAATVQAGYAELIWSKRMPALIDRVITHKEEGMFAAMQVGEFMRLTQADLPPALKGQMSSMIHSGQTNEIVMAARLNRELRLNAPEAYRAAFGAAGDELTRNRLAVAEWEVFRNLTPGSLDPEGNDRFIDLVPLLNSIKEGSTTISSIDEAESTYGAAVASYHNWISGDNKKLASASFVEVFSGMLQVNFPDIRNDLFEKTDKVPKAGDLNNADNLVNTLFRGQEHAVAGIYFRASLYKHRDPNLTIEQAFAMGLKEEIVQRGLTYMETRDGPTAVYDPNHYLGRDREQTSMLMDRALTDVLQLVKNDSEGTAKTVSTSTGQSLPRQYRLSTESVYDDPTQWALEIDLQGHHRSNQVGQGGLPVMLVHRPEAGIVVRYRIRFKDDSSFFLNWRDYATDLNSREKIEEFREKRRTQSRASESLLLSVPIFAG